MFKCYRELVIGHMFSVASRIRRASWSPSPLLQVRGHRCAPPARGPRAPYAPNSITLVLQEATARLKTVDDAFVRRSRSVRRVGRLKLEMRRTSGSSDSASARGLCPLRRRLPSSAVRPPRQPRTLSTESHLPLSSRRPSRQPASRWRSPAPARCRSCAPIPTARPLFCHIINSSQDLVISHISGFPGQAIKMRARRPAGCRRRVDAVRTSSRPRGISRGFARARRLKDVA
jgi:hypothetical protein